MHIDWILVRKIVGPIILLFAGAALDRIIERKPKLIAYFTHASVHNLAVNNPSKVHTHGIVIKSIGGRTASDIRVRHHVLPQSFTVFPVVEYRVENLQGGGVEIVFPALVPNEQISISYLYPSDLFYNQIHAGIRHSEGFATEVTALPTSQYPFWIRRWLLFLLVLGVIALVYLIINGGYFIVRMLMR